MEEDCGIFTIETNILTFTEEGEGVYSVENMEVAREEEVQNEEDQGMNMEELKALQAENFDFINKQRAPNTVRKTCRDIDRFISFLENKGEKRKPEKMEPARLDIYIGNYMKELKRKDGGDYEPDSISSVHGSLDRYL